MTRMVYEYEYLVSSYRTAVSHQDANAFHLGGLCGTLGNMFVSSSRRPNFQVKRDTIQEKENCFTRTNTKSDVLVSLHAAANVTIKKK